MSNQGIHRYDPVDYFTPTQWFSGANSLDRKIELAKTQLDKHKKRPLLRGDSLF